MSTSLHRRFENLSAQQVLNDTQIIIYCKTRFRRTKFRKMKNLRNTVTLIGRLGANPEVKELGADKAVAKITLATDDSYKNAKGEKVQSTQWHTIVAWNRQAKFVEKYLTKGSQIAIEGKLVHRNYEDAKGEKKYVTEVIANEFLMLS